MYTLNNISLSSFGFVPGKQSNSNVALAGFIDMPSRIGKTSHDWAGEVGIEPYVSASEIFFGGRDLNLTGYIKGLDRNDCEYKRSSIVNFINGFTDLVPLESKWGISNVLINGAIKSEYLNQTYLKISIPMREPVVPIIGIPPVGNSSELGIDAISFASMGGAFIELSGDRRNRTAPKSEQPAGYGKESYLITKTVAPELKLSIAIKQPTYVQMKEKVDAVMALFSKPGLRSLTVNNDKLRSFFVKDGFKASKIYVKDDYSFCLLECNLTEAGVAGTFADLVDSLGNRITDNEGNTIKIRL